MLFSFLWRCGPTQAVASSFLSFRDHTRHITVGRNPLDVWSARRRDLYLIKLNAHNSQISMPRYDSNPRSQQVNGRSPTPQNARLLGPACNANYRTETLHFSSTLYKVINIVIYATHIHVLHVASSKLLLRYVTVVLCSGSLSPRHGASSGCG